MTSLGSPQLTDQVLASLPHSVLLVAPDDRIAYANDAAELLLGSGRAALAKRRLSDLVGPTSPVLELVENVRRTRSTVSQYLLSWPNLVDRTARDVDVDASFGHAGSVVLMVQTRSLAEKIDRQLSHRGAARSVMGLARMLAHEIKNPLSGIRGAAQLLEQNVEASDRELTTLIRAETDRIVKLVNSMEVFSDERPIERVSTNVHSVLDHVLSVARNGFAANVRIIEDYDPSLPELLANVDQMVQVFLNLVKNASEAVSREADPTIIVRTAFRSGIRMTRQGAGESMSLPLEISVSDNGPGITREIHDHLFEPFVTTKRNGTGLGLPLVAKIIRDHGGVVDFASDANGTTFKVLMPKWNSR